MAKFLFQSRWMLALVFLLLDLYTLQAIIRIGKDVASRWFSGVYILFSVLAAMQIIFLFWYGSHYSNDQRKGYLLTFIVAFLLVQVSVSLFLLIDDARRLLVWIYKKIAESKKPIDVTAQQIPRSAFLSWAGVAVGASFFGTLAYGLSNKYAYRVRYVKQHFDNLPPAFKGLKIVQLSDIHSGSFKNKNAVARGVAMALAEKPDLILFTGDLVNNKATEMENYTDLFSTLHAPMGVFSTLGNHDYGDYVEWPSAKAKAQNLEDLKKVHAQMGWRLLMNEHVIFERNGEKIALLGIENWGAKGNFPKYGKMDLAYPGTENIPFKILMSHDPSHWDAEVRPKYNDIDLTLAGHTHGMQFGVEIPGFKWSPIQWMYKEWAGMYQDGKQFLYVNRGFGFLGYPGRVGIMPEITVIELS